MPSRKGRLDAPCHIALLVVAVIVARGCQAVATQSHRGVSLAKQGRHREAIQEFDRAIRSNPANPVPWHHKSLSVARLNRHEEALQCCEQAIRLKPDFGEAWVNKGVMLRRLGRYEEALRCQERAIEIDPRDEAAWSNKAAALGSLRRYEEALKCCERALELKPTFVDAWLNKGAMLGNSGRPQEALECYERALSIDPDFGPAWINKGVALMSLGRFQEANAAFDRAVELGGPSVDGMLERLGLHGRRAVPETSSRDSARKGPFPRNAEYRLDAVSGNGRYIAVSASTSRFTDQFVTFWDTATQEPVSRIVGRDDTIRMSARAIWDDGRALIVDGAEILVWDFRQNKKLRGIQLTHRVMGCAVSPDHKLLAASKWWEVGPLWFGSVEFWNLTNGKRLGRLHAEKTPTPLVAFLGDGRELVIHQSGKLKVVDVETRKPSRSLVETEALTQIAPSPDGKSILLALGREASLIDARTGDTVRVFRGHSSSVSQVAFSPDGRRIVTSDLNGVICVWSVDTFQPLWCIDEQERKPASVLQVLDDGTTLLVGGTVYEKPRTPKISWWDLELGKCLWSAQVRDEWKAGGAGDKYHSEELKKTFSSATP